MKNQLALLLDHETIWYQLSQVAQCHRNSCNKLDTALTEYSPNMGVLVDLMQYEEEKLRKYLLG